MSANLKTKELAAELRVSVETVKAWVRTGRIPCTKLGPKIYRYDLAAVLAALGVNEAASTTTAK